MVLLVQELDWLVVQKMRMVVFEVIRVVSEVLMQVLLLLVHHLRSQDHQQQVCVLDQLQESNNDMVTANPSLVLQQDEVCPKSTHGIENNGIPIFQLSMVDVADELAYWEMGVVAYVLGLNPNVKLFEGYCHRLWGKNNVDKVIPIKIRRVSS